VLELALLCGVVLGNRYQDLLANASAARCQSDRVVRYLFKSIPNSSKWIYVYFSHAILYIAP